MLLARYPQVLASCCAQHGIYSLHPEGQKPRILAVLHEHMDLLSHLIERFAP
jgi:hypothetical protein